jgi:Protein of unknown function (DUF4239)
MNQLVLARVIRWLSRRHARELLGISLAWFVVWTITALAVLEAIVPADDQADLSSVASSLMTAVGALFAFLTAFIITIEWGHRRDAEQTVGSEADASVRLAWASESPGVDGVRLRRELRAYLESVITVEWPTLGHGDRGSVATHDRLNDVQRTVRAAVADMAISPAISRQVVAATEAVVVSRADRLNVAGHDPPVPLFVLAFLSGIMLALNSIAVALRLEPGYGIMIVGLVIIIAMDLAIMVAISAPFDGSLRVHPSPLERVVAQLDAGRYGPVS